MERVKKQLVEVSRLMYSKGMVNAFEGNISVLRGERVYITPSAICKGFLTEDMIVVTDLEGNVLEGSYKPSSEIKLHLASYKRRKDIGSVVHAHPPYATAFAIANKPIEAKSYSEVLLLFGSIPIAPYGTPSTDEVFSSIEPYLAGHDVVLLANHGIVSVGSDVYEAFFKLESAETIAKTLTLALLQGGGKDLPDYRVKELRKMRCERTGDSDKTDKKR